MAEEINTEKMSIPPASQAIIREVTRKFRESADLPSNIQYALEALTKALNADRGVLFQIVGDAIVATNEYVADGGENHFFGQELSPMESSALVMEFLLRFPDETASGVISVSDTAQDENLEKMAPGLVSLLKKADVKSRLSAQLRSRGIFNGFIELQKSGETYDWSQLDEDTLQTVSEFLSVIVDNHESIKKIERDAKELRMIKDILALFIESKDKPLKELLTTVGKFWAKRIGFANAQIYLFDKDSNSLVPQIDNENMNAIAITDNENPVASAYNSGRLTESKESFFDNNLTWIIPLFSEEARYGITAIWQPRNDRPRATMQDKEMLLNVAGNLAIAIGSKVSD